MLTIQVRTLDRTLFAELDAASQGPTSGVPEGVLIGAPTKREAEGLHGFPTAEVIMFAVTLAASVPVNLFSSWLYDKLKEHANTVRINGKQCDLSVEAIEEAVSDENAAADY